MGQVTKDEARRERLREYEAALAAAREPVAVLSLFAQGREARAGGQLLEEAFSVTEPEGIEDAAPLPAAVWVALRQGDVDATVEALVRLSRSDFLLASHEELDSSYRLTTVEERRGIPDVELLQAQLAAFLQIPGDVVTIISNWGADDPRTAAEIAKLLDQRFGSTVPGAVEPLLRRQDGEDAAESGPPAPGRAAAADRQAGAAHADGTGTGAAAGVDGRPAQFLLPASISADTDGGLLMTSAEFSALLSLTPEQGAVLATLVRQTEITIAIDLPVGTD